jgi:hypothetical protein
MGVRGRPCDGSRLDRHGVQFLGDLGGGAETLAPPGAGLWSWLAGPRYGMDGGPGGARSGGRGSDGCPPWGWSYGGVVSVRRAAAIGAVSQGLVARRVAHRRWAGQEKGTRSVGARARPLVGFGIHTGLATSVLADAHPITRSRRRVISPVHPLALRGRVPQDLSGGRSARTSPRVGFGSEGVRTAAAS